MRATIDGRVYDTDRAEEIARFTREVDQGPLFCGGGRHWTSSHECILYQTDRGMYFACDTEDETMSAVTRREARRLVQEADPELYLELFGITAGV